MIKLVFIFRGFILNKKLFYVSIFLIIGILLGGCDGITPSTSTGITGNWTMTSSSQAGVTTSKCYIKDSSGSLTISNFRIIGEEHISWSTGYGSFKNSKITANIIMVVILMFMAKPYLPFFILKVLLVQMVFPELALGYKHLMSQVLLIPIQVQLFLLKVKNVF